MFARLGCDVLCVVILFECVCLHASPPMFVCVVVSCLRVLVVSYYVMLSGLLAME